MRRLVPILLSLAVAAPACSDAVDGVLDRTVTVDVSGTERSYRLVAPTESVAPMPLVLVFHGFAGTPDQVRELSGFAELAIEEGFAVAFPAAAGIIPAWRTDAWLAAPDVAFARAVVADTASMVSVDPTRVYATGMSNGGGMAGRLACAASDLFAAVGVVAAAHAAGSCDQERPVPIIGFHGDADRIVPIAGIPFVAAAPGSWIAQRAADNGCESDPVTETIADDVEITAFSGCDADVAFYEVFGGRHGWPGSARASQVGDSTTSIDATRLMWEFFVARNLP